MRVAFFVRKFPKLSESFIINEAVSLIELGCELQIYSSRTDPYEEDALSRIARSRQLMRNVRFAMPVPASHPERWKSVLTLLATHRIRPLSAMFQAFNVKRAGRDVLNLRELYRILPVLKTAQPDILHCQFGYVGIRWLPYLQHFDAPLVVSIRGADITRDVQTHCSDRYEPLFNQAALFLPNCRFFAERLEALGCPPEKIRVHYSPVDVDEFDEVRHVDGLPRSPRIAMVGRLVAKKGMRYGIEAVARLRARGYDATLEIVGAGPQREALARQAGKLRLARAVRFRGALDHDAIRELFARTDVFVAPSVTAGSGDMDAIPNTIKEALLARIPVVATRHGGIPELVRDRETGLLVEERDAAAIASAIEWIVEHPNHAARMADAGRACVLRRFSRIALGHDLLSTYRNLLDRQPSRNGRLAVTASQTH